MVRDIVVATCVAIVLLALASVSQALQEDSNNTTVLADAPVKVPVRAKVPVKGKKTVRAKVPVKGKKPISSKVPVKGGENTVRAKTTAISKAPVIAKKTIGSKAPVKGSAADGNLTSLERTYFRLKSTLSKVKKDLKVSSSIDRAPNDTVWLG
jgi:hypothetical protein